MRNVLITGAGGFVGCNLVKRFAEAGEQVIALDRVAPDHLLRQYLSSSIERISFIQADICDPAWHEAIRSAPVDLVVHAAAVTNVAAGEEISRATDAVSVNIGATANVMTWAAAGRPARVIYVSSSSVYGMIFDADEAIEESRPAQPSDLYGVTKVAAEQIALRLGLTSKLPVFVARLAGPFGPMERLSADRKRLSYMHAWCEAAVRGEPLTIDRGFLPRDYCYVADTAAAIYRLATTQKLNHHVYNVSSGVAVSCMDIIAALRKIIPDLRCNERETPAVNLIGGPVSSKRLNADTGWKPAYNLQTALEEYVDWLLTRAANSAEAGIS